MAATQPKAMALEHVWGALVGLLQALTTLAENANKSIEDDRAHRGQPGAVKR